MHLPFVWPTLPAYLLAALFLATTAPACRSSTVARVGNYEITEKDAAYRDAVVHIYYPQDQRTGMGLSQLKDAFTAAQVLANNGRAVTPELLAAEEKRIDHNTQAPAQVQRIKEIFGNDHEAYLKDFILPVFAQREVYYGLFLQDPAIQNASRLPAEAFLAKVLAKRTPLENATVLVIDPKNGLQWEPRAGEKGETKLPDPTESEKEGIRKLHETQRTRELAEAKRLLEVLADIPPDGVFPQVLDANDGWWVVRAVGSGRAHTGSTARKFEIVIFPKAVYQPWYEAERAKVPIS